MTDVQVVRAEIAALREEFRGMAAVIEVLLARHSDVTHLTIPEAARLLGIGRTTVRRRFKASIERIPGRRGDGIPIEKVFAGWMPLGAARRLVTKMRDAA